MENLIKIAVDAMGGDNSPQKIIDGIEVVKADLISIFKKNEIESIHGISSSVSSALIEWSNSKENKMLLNDLEAYGFDIDKKLETKGGKLTGITFVITGTFPLNSRQDLINTITENGGAVTTSVSKNTDYLIVGANPGSKLSKAESLGVAKINDEGLLKLI